MDNSIFIKSMLDYIENRVSEEITADTIADTAGFSCLISVRFLEMPQDRPL